MGCGNGGQGVFPVALVDKPSLFSVAVISDVFKDDESAIRGVVPLLVIASSVRALSAGATSPLFVVDPETSVRVVGSVIEVSIEVPLVDSVVLSLGPVEAGVGCNNGGHGVFADVDCSRVGVDGAGATSSVGGARGGTSAVGTIGVASSTGNFSAMGVVGTSVFCMSAAGSA